jgi:hypothetical protein
MKLRDAGRLAIFGAGLALLVALGLSARTTLGPLLRGRLLGMLMGVGLVCPICLAMCVYYLISTPEQNARFIKWAERHRWSRPPLVFDWTLLDPSDPDYRVTTFRYLVAKMSRGTGR